MLFWQIFLVVAQIGFNSAALSGPQAQGPSVLLASSAHSRQNRARMGARKRLLAYGPQDDEF
jgi:hypothetical protein